MLATSQARAARSIHRRLLTTATHEINSDPPIPLTRRQAIQQAKPFSEFLTDNFTRQHDYLRISLTERCNLRCLYCMPEEGIDLSPSRDILTTAEIEYLSSVFVKQGVTKIRLTGGEPTVRKDILPLMRKIGDLRRDGLKELALTTNGISLYRKLDHMVESGLTGVNISLDTLDPFQYQILTRRQGFNAVMKSVDRVKEMNKLGAGVKLKVNCVVMRGLNDHQILPFVEMTKNEDIEVRFIEYMPFGGNKWSKNKMMSYADMLAAIQQVHPDFQRLKDAKNDTSKTWQIPGYAGRVGFITSMTHNFCGTCNRLRITSDGNLKVCLHGNTEVSLRDMIRADGEPMDDAAVAAITPAKQQQLLEVIGAAVKRKKAKHAGPASPRSSSRSSFTSILPRPAVTAAISDLLAANKILGSPHQSVRYYSTGQRIPADDKSHSLTHVNHSGEAHMVDVSDKEITKRIAIACARINFSHATPLNLIKDNNNKKGDVLGTARIAGIMAAKKTSELIPLCHPLAITKVNVELETLEDAVQVEARVDCVGNTGVEMEALTAATVSALTIYDMCKAVDRSMVIDGAEVVYKSGGRSGTHVSQQWLDQKGQAYLNTRGLPLPGS